VSDLPLVDTHVHFWDHKHPRLRWNWLERDAIHPLLGDIDGLKRLRYTADEFLAETRFQNVSKVIHVQAALGSPDPVEETRWLDEMATCSGIPNAIVAEAWLARPDVETQLEQHAAFPRVRGIRDFGQGDYLEDPAWRRGYRQLERFGFIFCLDSTPERYQAARRVADDCPGVTMCVDHCGVPLERGRPYFEQWRSGLRELAEGPNVIVKISGLGMRDPRWTPASIRPWFLACIDAFGLDRVVLATNWPVDSLFSSYGDLVDAYRDLLREFSVEEARLLFSKNAERIFRI
jgi:predicted TIM-barrel fold metal-dependent hydrolase